MKKIKPPGLHGPNNSPEWVLPLFLGILVVLGVLGSLEVIKMGGQSECEESGGVFMKLGNVRQCVFEDELDEE